MSKSPLSIDISNKKQTVEHILRIETDKFTVCTPKIETKKKWIFFQQKFVIHVKRDGTIDFEELK